MLKWDVVKHWPHDWLRALDEYRWQRAWSRLGRNLHPEDMPSEIDPFAEWHDEGTPVG